MPEAVIPDQYADQIPRFTLPKEFQNPPPETKAPEAPAEAPKEPKPVAEAATTEPPKAEAQPEAEKVTEGKDPDKGTSRYLKRIERAHRERAEAQAKAEALQREVEHLKQSKSPVSSAAPRMEDYTDVQEYAKAYAAYEKDNALKEYQRKQAEESATAQRSKLEQEWSSKVAKAIAKYDDFEEVVGDLKPVTPWGYTLLAAESGEEVAYYLGKHPKEAESIFSKPPLLQAYEIGRLEAKLLSKPEAPKQPSKAPPPIAPVTGPAQVSEGEYKPGMPFEEYRKIGNKMFRGR